MSTSFERWIRGNAPVTHDDADDARHLWTRLEDRIHQRRQSRVTRGSGLAAAAVLVLVLGVLDVNPLGGNNWNLIASDSREGYAEDPLTGKLYTSKHGFKDGMTGDLTAQEYWETVREQQLAGNYTLEAIDFYQVGDHIGWTNSNRHQVGSESTLSTLPIKGKPELPTEVWRWLAPHVLAYAVGNHDGRWREVEARQYEVGGQLYWFRVWTTDTEYGPVYYGSAVFPNEVRGNSDEDR